MAQNHRNLQASVLDRLLDREPGRTREGAPYRLLTAAQVRALVIRDLEHLLNSRRSIVSVPASFRHLENSLFTYGLRDFIARNPQSPRVQLDLARDIETAIARFEPRLRNVRVRLEQREGDRRNLHFRIEALLVVEPLREPVAFDTVLDVNRGEVRIAS